jgi:copper chaperone CopZ
MKSRKFTVKGLDETGMRNEFRNSLKKHDGISSIKVDLKLQTVTVDYDEGKYSQEDVKKIFSDMGLTVTESVETFSSHWSPLQP